MDIPDEAYAAAIAAHHAGEGLVTVVEAAAPHIARSAQVAVLRELDAYWITCCKRPGANMPTLLWAALAVREKADALEAGAGQTGTTEREN